MSQNQPKTVNNRKALLCSRAFLQKSTAVSSFELNSEEITEKNLLKYFPKYINELIIESNTSPVISKVKRAKFFHVFQSSKTDLESKTLRRNLLYNKEKHIRAFYEENEFSPPFNYSKQLVQEIRAFTGFRSLKLHSDKPKLLQYVKRICKYMASLHKLEYLELEIRSEKFMDAISRISSYDKILESLKTLRIECMWRDLSEGRVNLVRAFLQHKNLLKYTTNLTFGCFNNQPLLELFEEILLCCSKLVTLKFDVDKPKQEKNYLESIPRYFQALANLNNLQALTIISKDFLTLLRDFTLPASIQKVDLSLLLFELPELKDCSSTSGDLPEIVTTFCDKWSQFKNLKALSIRIGQHFENSISFITRFVQYWLKKVENIKDLIVDLSEDLDNQSPNNLFSLKDEFDFSAFMESIKHFKETLKSLTLLDTGEICLLSNLPEHPLDFPHLHKLYIKVCMPSDKFQLQRLFSTNLGHLLNANNNEKPFEMLLDGLSFDLMASFMSFIKSFDYKRRDKQRALDMTIAACISSQDSNLNNEFCSFYTLAVGNLKIHVKVSSSEAFTEKTEPGALLQKSLDFLKVSPYVGSE